MFRKKLIIAVLCALPFAGRAASAPEQWPSGPVMSVHFDYYPKDLARIEALEHRLATALTRTGVGELDVPELHIDGNDGYFDMYGADPDRVYKVAEPILKSSELMTGAEVTKKYGARKETFVIQRGDIR